MDNASRATPARLLHPFPQQSKRGYGKMDYRARIAFTAGSGSGNSITILDAGTALLSALDTPT